MICLRIHILIHTSENSYLTAFADLNLYINSQRLYDKIQFRHPRTVFDSLNDNSAYAYRILTRLINQTEVEDPYSNIDPNSGKELSFENLISADLYDDGSGQEKIWDFKEEPFDTELRDNIFIEDSSNGTVIGNFFLSDPNTAGQRAELAIAPWSWNDHYTYPTLY